MGGFPFLAGFLISIGVGLFSIFRLGGIVSLKEAFFVSIIKMLLTFLVVFTSGLILELLIRQQFKKRKGFNIILKEERP
ncbi:MAG: hypothetical protein AB1630_03170 [bacterium]